jgi:hypothetical protein
MLIRPTELEAIRRGDIDLGYRLWDRPRLLVGTKMRTRVGLVEVTSVDQVEPDSITDLDAVRAGAASRADLFARLGDRPGRAIYRVGLRYAGADPRVALREVADLTGEERADLLDRLARFDKAAPRGPWTGATLEIINRRPEVRAPDLAAELGYETVVFKRNVRKLKELGLTESLSVGYRLSPRGRALTGLS